MQNNSYERNFLTEVIFRIDFVNPIKVDDFAKENLNDLRRFFPFYSPIDTTHNNIEINIDENGNKTVERDQKILRKQIFFKEPRIAQMEISANALSISYSSYSNFDSLRTDIEGVLDLLMKTPNITIGRTGLRYINIFENKRPGRINWSTYITPNMLPSEQWNDFKVLQHMSALHIKQDACLVKIQYGLFNGEIPNERIKDAYVLDIDAYSEKMCDLSAVKESIPKWNDTISEIFELTITDRMREKLNDESTEL